MAARWLVALGFLAAWGCAETGRSDPDAAPSDQPSTDAEPRPERPDATPVDGAVMVSVRVVVQIDGRSQLTLKANTAQWEHFNAAAPGRHSGTILPTTINGVDWFPMWPDVPNSENRDCNCKSDVFDGVAPPVPTSPVTTNVVSHTARTTPALVQAPDANNEYTAILEINDLAVNSSAIYDVELQFVPDS